MTSEASKALEALERDVGAVGVEAAALRLAARLAGVEADIVRAFLDGNGQTDTLDVAAVAKRLSGVLGVEAGRPWSCWVSRARDRVPALRRRFSRAAMPSPY